jgi:DNA-binding XRE family transcriptional regulator
MNNTTDMRLSLKALRCDRNLTQRELGKVLNVTNKTISSWEKGETVPSLKKVEEICNFFGVSYESIRWKV